MVRLMIRILLVLFVSITAGCNLPSTQANPQENPSNQNQGSSPEHGSPQIIIHDPQSGHFANPNTSVLVHSIASDRLGISRIDLLVNGIVVRSDETPDGIPQKQYALLQAWIPPKIGDYILAVIAYCCDGTPSEQAAILVHVVEPEGIPETGSENPNDCIATALTTLNIRQGPGVIYKIDGSLLLGQKAYVTGKNGNGHWWQIDFNGAAGWISAQHTITEGACNEIAEVAAPPPPAGATPIFRTPAPIAQAGDSQPGETETTTEWTIWEVIVDVWVMFFGPGPDDDSGYPPPEVTPSEGYPPPGETTPTRSTMTTSPEGYPPAVTMTSNGYPPPATGTPAGYPPPEITSTQEDLYPPPEDTQVLPSPTRTITPTSSETVMPTELPTTTSLLTRTPAPTDPPTPTVPPTAPPEEPTEPFTAIPDTPTPAATEPDANDNDNNNNGNN